MEFDLAEATGYVADLCVSEGMNILPCYRTCFYDTSNLSMAVDWSGGDEDRSGETARLPDGSIVTLNEPTFQWSGFDIENRAILLAHAYRPLTHKLLMVHEIAHAASPTVPKHSPLWVWTFLDMTERHLPYMADELVLQLATRGVI